MCSILVIEDDRDTGTLLRDALHQCGYDAHYMTSAKECIAELALHPADVVVTDVRMPGMSGIELCGHIRQHYADTLTIVLTGHADLELAIAAIRAGAYDFITKPFRLDALIGAVARAIDHIALRFELRTLRTAHADATEGIVGVSPGITEMVELIRHVANGDATVLVTGESGTGKELVARAIHRLSPRRDEPFIAVNCAAVPTPLLESELFGHVRGAFTDAKDTRSGLFVQAGRGTIFLDEIGEMPIEMQVKLLRALQARKLRPVGGDHELPFEARIITATNKDLEAEVRERRFRKDLFYRINVVPVPVPSLRTRSDDVLLLAQTFLNRAATRIAKPVHGISPPAARLLLAYDWPGNVRELENCIERAVTLSRLDEITVEDLPAKIVEYHADQLRTATDNGSELLTLEETERRYVRAVLDTVRGNKTQAARILGIDRRSLYRRLEPHGSVSKPEVYDEVTNELAMPPADDSEQH